MMMVSTPNNLREVLRARYTYEARESVEKGMRSTATYNIMNNNNNNNLIKNKNNNNNIIIKKCKIIIIIPIINKLD